MLTVNMSVANPTGPQARDPDPPGNVSVPSRTVAVDTSDLESHYEFYRHEPVKMSKTVATDTHDLDCPRVSRATSSVAVGTGDLGAVPNNYYISISNSNVSVGCDQSLECGSWSGGVFVADASNRVNGGETYCNDQPKEQVEKSVFIKADVDLVPQGSYQELKDSRPLVLKKDLQAKGNGGHSVNVSDASDSENGDLEDGCSNVSDDVKDVIADVKRENDDGLQKWHKPEGHHVGEKRFECDICKATFTRKHTMTVHLRVHCGPKPFPCSVCGKTFVTFGQVRSHSRTHAAGEGVGEEAFDCKECGRIFQLERQLSRHQCYHSDGKQYEACETCGKTFRSVAALYNHVRIYHKAEAAQLAMKRKKALFECLTCGKVFRCRSALKCHETVHTGERNFVCETCNKAFPTKASLKAHSSTHTGVKPFVCMTCGKVFAKNDSLKTHLRKHTGERPFKCDICGQSFDRNFTLKNHRVTHTGEKTHICPMCGKAFSTRGALSTHERTRHNTNPEKPRKPYKRRLRDFEPCVCDVCGKVYSNQANLRIHKAIHTGDKPFLCTICGQSFAKKYTLQCHMRKHTDERPFACDVCGLTFFRNHTLKTHKLRHTGERPHTCPLCGKSFIQSASLSYHIRNHDRPPKVGAKSKKRKKKLKEMSPDQQMLPDNVAGAHAVFVPSPYQHPLVVNKMHADIHRE